MLAKISPDPNPPPLLDEPDLFFHGFDVHQVQPMPSHLEASLFSDGVTKLADDHGDFHAYFVGRYVGLGLDVPKGAFVSLEGLHDIDDFKESIGPADDEEGQDCFVVGSGLIPDSIRDQNAVEPVVGLHAEGGFGVLGRTGMAGFGHAGIIGEGDSGRKGKQTRVIPFAMKMALGQEGTKYCVYISLCVRLGLEPAPQKHDLQKSRH